MDEVTTESPKSLPERGGWVRRMDECATYFLLVPIMLAVQFWIGGLRGFLFGFAAALAVLPVYRVIRFLIILRFAKRVARPVTDHEVNQVVTEACLSDEHSAAATRIRDIIARDGETYPRLIALASLLVDAGRPEEAMPLIVRAANAAPEHFEWQPQIIEVAALRAMGSAAGCTRGQRANSRCDPHAFRTS